MDIDLIINSHDLEDQRGKLHTPSRPIDWGRDYKASAFDSTLRAILSEIDVANGRKRRRAGGAAVGFTNVLKALILDLYVAWKADRKLLLGISKSRGDYNRTSDYHTVTKFYHGLELSFADVKAAFNGLAQLGYMKIAKAGFYDKETDKGERTRIIATEKLVTLLDTQARLRPYDIRRRVGEVTVILKDKEKNIIRYRPNEFTKKASGNLERINRCLSSKRIDVYLTDEELEELKERQFRKSLVDDTIHPTVDFCARTLKRVFNNNDWTQGGRFYGGWWQSIPRDYRKYIHINDKRTVELDFSGMHPAMLYAEVGSQPLTDPYDMNLGTVARDVKKKAFNAMVNAPNRRIKIPDEFDKERSGFSWRELLNKIQEFHHPIAGYFHSGYGLVLQGKDADIAERVMLHFARMGYPCLPVHDSFIIHHDLKDELQEAMEIAFEEVVESPAKIDTKLIFTYEPSSDPYEGGMEQVINELCNGEGPYRGYNQRGLEWSSYSRNIH